MYRAALQVIAVSVIALTGMKRRSITMQIIWYYSAACTLCTVRNPVPITMSTLQVFFCGTSFHCNTPSTTLRTTLPCFLAPCGPGHRL